MQLVDKINFEEQQNWKRKQQQAFLDDLFGDRKHTITRAPSYRPYSVNPNVTMFLQQFDKPPLAYHMTHFANAVQILKSGILLSRNNALGQFEECAGSVVNRLYTAHDYVRFYFTNNAPTYFYNQFLGKSINDRYYQTALDMGLPKCPMPIFLIFNIDEILQKIPDRCYYSNGNLQRNNTQIYKITNEPTFLNTRDISVISGDTKDARQQEFLIRDSFNFSEFRNIQIVCSDFYQKNWLSAIFSERWKDNIKVEPMLFSGSENRRLCFVYRSASIITISTDYEGQYEFCLKYEDQCPRLYKAQILREECQKKYLSGEITFSTENKFSIYFIDKQFDKQWLIYKYPYNEWR